jgi:predicted deacylase
MIQKVIGCLLLIAVAALAVPPKSTAAQNTDRIAAKNKIQSASETQHVVYLQNTDYELHVYKITGAQRGKTLMIIGGMHGDEPGGYLAADLYADMALRKGGLIVVPRANFLSIISNKRAKDGDMNRRFSKGDKSGDYEDRIVDILKSLIQESDYILNLHEGSGFYSDRWESPTVNPLRFGQSVIADADVYKTNDGRTINLGKTAREVVAAVNSHITNKAHQFRFNNHKTFEKDTPHAEQRMSATYFALSRYGKPAFAIETSQEILDLPEKVRYQTLAINAFMEKFGIVPENPKIVLDPPKLAYLVVSVNGTKKIVTNGEELKLNKGDKITILYIAANYARGLSVDFQGGNAANYLNKEFTYSAPLKIFVKKDRFKCGEVFLATNEKGADASAAVSATASGTLKYLVVEINGVRQVLKDGEHLKTVKGDILKLTDLVADGAATSSIKVNMLGFVPPGVPNTGEDRGYAINTAKDLWIKYSENKEGRRYPVVITEGKKNIGQVYVDLEEPRMDYIVIRQNMGKRWYFKGETITASARDTLDIVDVKTNVAQNAGVSISIDGRTLQHDKTGNPSIDLLALSGADAGKNATHRLIVTREGVVIGKINIAVDKPVALR